MDRGDQLLHALSYNWQKKAPHKDPMRLRNLCMVQLTTSVTHAIKSKADRTCKGFQQMCDMLKTLPLELKTIVVQETTASQVINDHSTFSRILLLHLLSDVEQISIISDAASGSSINFSKEECIELLEKLDSVSSFSILGLHLEGVTFAKGVLSEIISRSPKLSSIHINGEEAATEVLAFIAKNPRGLHSLHLDDCSVSDRDVVNALVKSYKEADYWGDTEFTSINDPDIDGDFPPLCHLSIQSPSVTVCGAVVLLHYLRNLKSLQYSYWNSSICNLLYYLQKQSPKAAPFSLTSMSLWCVTEKSLDTLKFCPNLQYLMMECTNPALASMEALKNLPKLCSLTLRLIPEELIVSALKAVGKQLVHLHIEFEEYARTPIKWQTIQAIHAHARNIKRLELHHINIVTESGDTIAPLHSPFFSELCHLNLSSVDLQPALLSRILCKNASLETLVLDINQEALTDSAVMALVKNNQFNHLYDIYIRRGSLSTLSITNLMTLPSLEKVAIQLSQFPSLSAGTFSLIQNQIMKGNYRCRLENDDKDE
ncbi:hypothetical protein SK128_028578 [Halocaridina rubra]|uniref:Uncharacterized protein n=1 Tax=Halocaridina rubra TaxID=373956 RepID=A0AAN8X261_HALRR